jgi:hypothetical protein
MPNRSWRRVLGLSSVTEVGSTADAVQPPTAPWAYVAPILVGLLIAAAGLVPWMLLAQVNARVRPDWP